MIGPAPTMRELVSVSAHRSYLPFALLHDALHIADPDAESENGRQSDKAIIGTVRDLNREIAQ
jgi:hypothetical protein